MPITIKKGNAPRSAPVVEGALKVEHQQDDWKKIWKHVPPPNAKPQECSYCGQFYIVPCDDARHQACANFKHFAETHS